MSKKKSALRERLKQQTEETHLAFRNELVNDVQVILNKWKHYSDEQFKASKKEIEKVVRNTNSGNHQLRVMIEKIQKILDEEMPKLQRLAYYSSYVLLSTAILGGIIGASVFVLLMHILDKIF